MFGQQLADALRASHVDASLAITSDRPTTLAFVRLVNGHATYSFFDENSAGRMLTADDLPALPADVSCSVFGGISLACEPGADAYAALLAREGIGRAVMLDPNIRPGFHSGHRCATAPGLERHDREGRYCQSVRRRSELDRACPAVDDGEGQTLLKAGPAIVILTRGGDGATGFMADGTEVYVPAATRRNQSIRSAPVTRSTRAFWRNCPKWADCANPTCALCRPTRCERR